MKPLQTAVVATALTACGDGLWAFATYAPSGQAVPAAHLIRLL